MQIRKDGEATQDPRQVFGDYSELQSAGIERFVDVVRNEAPHWIVAGLFFFGIGGFLYHTYPWA